MFKPISDFEASGQSLRPAEADGSRERARLLAIANGALLRSALAGFGRRRLPLASGAQRMGDAVMKRFLALDLFTPRWGYIFRVALAATLALWLAYYLQLETPYSAATTVFLSASPVQGVTLSKGTWRVLGTIFGALVTLLLFALFCQTPALFVLGFSVWLGICVGLSTLLRHFRAYGAVVAGYTIGLVAYGAVDQPDQIFEHGINRVSVVALGVISLGLVTALFSRRSMSAKLQSRLLELTAAVGKLAADSLAPGMQLASRRQGLIGDIYALDDLLEFAATESVDVALRAGDVRHVMASLFAVVVGSARVGRVGCPTLAETAAGSGMMDAVATLGVTGTGTTRACETIASVRAQLSFQQSVSDMIDADRVDEILEDYQEALIAFACFLGASNTKRYSRFRFHLDTRGALENGMRATIIILLAGALWIATAWTSAFLMILLIAPFCGLLAMTGNPVAGAVEFTKGIVAAVIAGFVCSFGILPHVTGFPLLIAAMAPFWVAGLVATTVPKTGQAGTAYLLTFMTMVGPTNLMAFDVANYLNSGVAFILAGVLTLLSFRILFPRSPLKQALRVSAAIRDDALATLRRAPSSRRLAWQHRQHQRLTLLATHLKGDGKHMAKAIDDGLAAIHLGRAAFHIREILAGTVVSQPVARIARNGLNALNASRDRPDRAVREAHRAAEQLRQLGDAPIERVSEVGLLAASFSEIASLLKAHSQFFHPEKCRC